MIKHPRSPDLNVVPMPAKPAEKRDISRHFTGHAGVPAPDGSPGDPRLQEAMRLMEAFLAIEDEQGRAALITLAERLVSYDWIRNAQRR